MKIKVFITSALISLLIISGCKKKYCGIISVIGTEISPANGQPVYTIYLESGEQIRTSSRGNYQVGQSFCND